jgi:hypothetical protein
MKLYAYPGTYWQGLSTDGKPVVVRVTNLLPGFNTDSTPRLDVVFHTVDDDGSGYKHGEAESFQSLLKFVGFERAAPKRDQ